MNLRVRDDRVFEIKTIRGKPAGGESNPTKIRAHYVFNYRHVLLTQRRCHSEPALPHLHKQDADGFRAELPGQATEVYEEHEYSQTERVVHACGTLPNTSHQRRTQ